NVSKMGLECQRFLAKDPSARRIGQRGQHPAPRSEERTRGGTGDKGSRAGEIEQDQASQGAARQTTHVATIATAAPQTREPSGAAKQAACAVTTATAALSPRELWGAAKQAGWTDPALAAGDSTSQAQANMPPCDTSDPGCVGFTGEYDPELYKTVEDKVYLDHGRWIHESLFKDLMAKTESMSVREAAVNLFSTAGLHGRSITGASSNRTKSTPKPALDPTLMMVLTEDLKQRFLEEVLEVYSLNTLLPRHVNEKGAPGKLSILAAKYGVLLGMGDVALQSIIRAEFSLWAAKWRREQEKGPLPSTAVETLQESEPELYPNIRTLLRVIATLPGTPGIGVRGDSVALAHPGVRAVMSF
ncbi:hypothetical protein HPB47_007781, partial [Ixodes persulcatus]